MKKKLKDLSIDELKQLENKNTSKAEVGKISATICLVIAVLTSIIGLNPFTFAFLYGSLVISTFCGIAAFYFLVKNLYVRLEIMEKNKELQEKIKDMERVPEFEEVFPDFTNNLEERNKTKEHSIEHSNKR